MANQFRAEMFRDQGIVAHRSEAGLGILGKGPGEGRFRGDLLPLTGTCCST
ncbi:MAG: hypothetical protein JRE01_00220 [Deltaproteobacteria bacterium]|nr:hypothetical protein [Deltaproteobacteria bacterium]